MAVNGKKKKKKDNYKNGSREVENEISKLSLPLYGKKTVVPSGTFPSFQVNRAYISKTNLYIILGNPKS